MLNVYGEGEIREQLQVLIDKNGIANTFILNEPVSQIEDKYLESSIYIMSSRFEGFPMVLLEAMSCGLPCVSFDCPNGARDMIQDGQNGFLVDYLNVEMLADKICVLMGNEGLRVEMGKRAREYVAKYDNNQIMILWENLFNDLSKIGK